MSDLIVPLVDHVVGRSASDIPEHVSAITKSFLFDTIGLMVAGTKAPGYDLVVEQFTDWGGKPEATVLGRLTGLPAPSAALVNALAAHAFDFDDTHERGDMHVFALVVSAALAAAERRGGVNGRELLTAVTIGADLGYRLALGITRYRGWHPTATCGVFAAAAAAGRIMGLNKTQMHNAMGIAYSLSAGNFQGLIDGSLTKRLQPGFAARAGMEAAVLASRGITGAKHVLQGCYGFYPLYEAGEYNPDIIIDRLGSWYEVEAASLKPYPSCRFCHGTIDAILDMCEVDGLRVEDVDSIVVKMPHEADDYVGGPYAPGDSPQVSAQFSTAYNVAVALSRGRVGLAEFDTDTVVDPDLRALSGRVKTVRLDDDYCFGPQEIIVALRDGSTLSRTVEFMKGHPNNPMSREEQLAKVSECLSLGGAQADAVERLAQWTDGIEDDETPLAGLFQLMSHESRDVA